MRDFITFCNINIKVLTTLSHAVAYRDPTGGRLGKFLDVFKHWAASGGVL